VWGIASQAREEGRGSWKHILAISKRVFEGPDEQKKTPRKGKNRPWKENTAHEPGPFLGGPWEGKRTGPGLKEGAMEKNKGRAVPS